MTEILHISDLHFVKNADSYNMQSILLREAAERVSALPRGEKLLIVTGDFHNFAAPDYEDAAGFLDELIRAMDLDPAQDVFLVPGNHDVSNNAMLERLADVMAPDWQKHKSAAISMLQAGAWEFLDWRMEAFVPYCQFARRLGVYPEESSDPSDTLPARVHIRRWRDKLNLLHLNTALIADGKTKENQLADVNTAASPELWKDWYRDDLPALAIGHNSFCDLEKTQRNALKNMFAERNVSAYLCGDTHLLELDDEKQIIAIESGAKANRRSIPNIVCAKSVADMTDHYSDFGYYWHRWNEDSGYVTLEFHRWSRERVGHTTLEINNDGYTMRGSSHPEASVPLPKDLGQLLQAPSYPETDVIAFFDGLAARNPEVSSYEFIFRIHRWFLPHEKESPLLKRMQEILEKDLRKDTAGLPAGFLDYGTAKRDFVIYYCLGLYCKRQNKVDRGSLCLKKLLERYSVLFTGFPLHKEVEGWFYRRKADRASKEEAIKQNLKAAEECDRSLIAAIPINENAGVYNSFASTVSKKLEYEYEHKNRNLWDSPEDRMRDWREASGYIPQIIEYYKAAWHAESDYGKHHFIYGKLFLFAPNSRTIGPEERKKQIACAKDEFYAALECENSDNPDFEARQQEYRRYIGKCGDQAQQLEDAAASTGKFAIRCDYAEQTNRRPRLRKPNEDFQLRNDEQGFFVLADGVTRPHGEYRNPSLSSLAAECARELCQAIQNSLLSSMKQDADPIRRMKTALIAGNQCVRDFQTKKWAARLQNTDNSYPPCCTLLLALFCGDTLYFYNCCDTVGYLVRQGVKIQLTEHYNWLAEMLKYEKPVIYKKLHNNPEDPAGFAIVNGDERFAQFLRIGQLKLASGDRVILSTDGLTEFLAAASGPALRGMTAEDMIQQSEAFDQQPFRRYADDKSCVIIDVL